MSFNLPEGAMTCPKCGRVCDSMHVEYCNYPYFTCNSCNDLFKEENMVGDLCEECHADAVEEEGIEHDKE